MPIRQFFYFDAIECLPENVFQPSNEVTTESSTVPNFSSEKSRYYSQEIVFGKDFQEKLGKSKYFVVRKAKIDFENTEIFQGWFWCHWL